MLELKRPAGQIMDMPKRPPKRGLKALADYAERVKVPKPAQATDPSTELAKHQATPEIETGEDLFRAAMNGVQKLAADKERRAPAKRTQSAQPSAEAEVLAEMQALVRGESEFRISDTHDFQYGLAPGVSRRVLDRLKKGEFSARRHIDLHGHTQDQARAAMQTFVKDAHLAGERCVLVVTGRGLHSEGGIGVLREALPRWLSRAPLAKYVLAYCTARRVDGGPGAYYVLLRK